MPSDDWPESARRRINRAVREAREAKGFTQQQVADAMEWSVNKIMRIESGDVSVSANDLRELLKHLEITDETRIEDLLKAARLSDSRRKRWNSRGLTPAMRKLIELETNATAIKQFSGSTVPGLLQTPPYARAVLAKWSHLREFEVQARVEARMRRREQVLSRTEPPEVRVLLDEAVLRRPVGGPAAWRAQVAELLEYAGGGHFRIRAMPFTREMALFMNGSFDTLYFGAERTERDAVMYRESYGTDEIVEDPRQIRQLGEDFDQLWDAALDEEESLRWISLYLEEAAPAA